jgi:formylglycine-generating enzyme required for sulfatase activity/serine/threonine protein kinase
MDLPTGYLLLDRYRIDAVLGQGGFGKTYRVFDIRLNQYYCVKELFIGGSSTRGGDHSVNSIPVNGVSFSDFKQKFIREAQDLARFRHPNIVQVINVFEANNTAYYVMEFVDGVTLKEQVERHGPYPRDAAIPVMRQLLDAVEEVHKRGMLHRDIKPSNVLMTTEGRLVLIDFGSAREFQAGKAATQTAMVTPGYAPWEQYSEQGRRDATSDIYALGATMYFLLTGERPLAAPDRISHSLPAPHELNSQVDSQISSAVMLAMEMRPEDRFQSIANFKQALHLLSTKISSESSTHRPSHTSDTKQEESVNRSEETPPKEESHSQLRYMKIALVFFIVIAVGFALSRYLFWGSNQSIASGFSSTELTIDTAHTPVLGSLFVTTAPDGAEVILNGVVQGQTPYTIHDLVADTYAIELQKPGYNRMIFSAVVEGGKVTQLNEELFFDRDDPIQQLIRNMFLVEGGIFTMGCTAEQGVDCKDWEQPARRVTVRNFKISMYEVTQKQWYAVMGSDPRELHNTGCDECPVEGVSWDDVQKFISRLNRLTGRTMRLPTEAEWEYAARGGKHTKGYKYSGSDDIHQVAWHTGNSENGFGRGTQNTTWPVGQKQPNELGIYDMSGNVWEWCEDDWHETYRAAPSDGRAWVDRSRGSLRVIRGGSWANGATGCRVSYRYSSQSTNASKVLGFRLASDP